MPSPSQEVAGAPSPIPAGIRPGVCSSLVVLSGCLLPYHLSLLTRNRFQTIRLEKLLELGDARRQDSTRGPGSGYHCRCACDTCRTHGCLLETSSSATLLPNRLLCKTADRIHQFLRCKLGRDDSFV